MARTFDFAGASGQTYRYTLLEGQTIWPSGGNYLYVKTTKQGPKVLLAEQTESLFRGLRDRWEEAKADHGATDIFLRLNVTGTVRRAELDDIRAHYQPPMNEPPAAPSHEEEQRAAP
ncbi:MAG TPA: hypothetical protein VD906_02445 [Caulobacteraceae bacterium]|nr:hypothetical protein [Caulobacteraceae bacterium]